MMFTSSPTAHTISSSVKISKKYISTYTTLDICDESEIMLEYHSIGQEVGYEGDPSLSH